MTFELKKRILEEGHMSKDIVRI